MPARTGAYPTPARGSRLTIGFGLVNVDVKLAPLVREQRTRGRMLCSEHEAPIHYETVCEQGEVCETVTGHEWGGGFLLLDAKALESDRDGRFELTTVVSLDVIDPLYFEKTYLVWPQKGHEQGFDLLASVLRGSGKAAVGTSVLSKSTRAVVVRWSQAIGCLVAHTCTYDANIAWDDVELVRGAAGQRPEPDERYAAAAWQLVAALEADGFAFEAIADEYDGRLREAIEAAAQSRAIVKPSAPTPEAPPDLMEACAPRSPRPSARRRPTAASETR